MITDITGGWAYSVFGFISVPLLPLPFFLFKWGSSLRAKSKYGPEIMMGNNMEEAVMKPEEHGMGDVEALA